MSGYLAWALILLVVGVWELVSLLVAGYPTLGAIIRFVLRVRGGRWVLFGGWMWIGWHFLIRYHPHAAR